MKNLKNDIKTGNYKSVYLFFGEEDYLRKLYEKQLIKKLIPEEAALMNLDVTDGKNYTLEKLVSSCETPPFMAERRLAVFKDTGLFAPGKKDETEKCEKYISAILKSERQPLTVVVFSESKIDKRGKLYKIIEKSGGAVEFNTPPEKDVVDWIVKEFKKSNISISPSNASILIRNAPDMNALVMEMDKLIAYKGNGSTVKEEDIDLICIKSLESKIFGLISAIGGKDKQAAVSMYHNLIMAKESPIGILSLMARQFGIILRVTELNSQKRNANDIAEALGLRSFIITDALKQSRLFSYKDLLAAYAECLDTDVSIKTGRIAGETGVELLIAKYSQ